MTYRPGGFPVHFVIGYNTTAETENFTLNLVTIKVEQRKHIYIHMQQIYAKKGLYATMILIWTRITSHRDRQIAPKIGADRRNCLPLCTPLLGRKQNNLKKRIVYIIVSKDN